MKNILATTGAIAVSAMMSLPAAAQQPGPPLLNGETATAYAARVNACGAAPLLGARFAQGGDVVEARCEVAGTGGIGPGPAAAAAAAGVGALLIIALDGSSSTTTSQ
ncbi:MAG: hypothetical protein ACE369_20195 [Roseovarius sp.]